MQIGPPHPARDGRPDRFAGRTPASALRRGRRIGARASLRHELVELGLVLRRAQADEELLKLALLLFEAPQGLLAIVVEDLVAARSRRRLPPGSGLVHAVHAAIPTA